MELFDGGLNLRVLFLDQNAERKRAHITDPAQQSRLGTILGSKL
jgi:hypothetical protein